MKQRAFGRKKCGSVAAFTVIELMAASAVFILMLVFTLQMITRTNKLSTQSSKQIEAVDAARSGLDAIARDMKTIVRTQGFTFIQGTDGNNNDYIAFLCSGRAGSSMSAGTNQRYSGVCYKVFYDTGLVKPGNSSLLRMQSGWGADSSNLPAWNPSTNTAADLLHASSFGEIDPSTTAQVNAFMVSDKVIRMEIVYVWKDGTVTADASGAGHNVDALYSSLGALPSGVHAVNLSQLSAVIVGLVAIDQKSLDLLVSQSGSINGLAGMFGAAGANNQTPLDVWKSVNFANATPPVPEPVRSGVRYLQRIIPVN